MLKIAVQLSLPDYPQSNYHPQFIELSRGTPLMTTIADLCVAWGLKSPPETYALKFEGGYFVTESSKDEIQNGNVFNLTLTPSTIVAELLEKLETYTGFPQLELLSPDPTFRHEIRQSGREALIFNLILDNLLPKDSISQLFNSIYDMVRDDDPQWWTPLLTEEMIERIISYINVNPNEDTKITTGAFRVLCVITPHKRLVLTRNLSIPSILRYFTYINNPCLQRLSVCLINQLFRYGNIEDRRLIKLDMERERARLLIVEYIINKKIDKEMNHELYILQTLLLNQLKDRMYTGIQSGDQKALEKIKELRRRAFAPEHPSMDAPNTPQPRTHRYNTDYKKLGFRNDVDPTQDFRETPPGTLALDLMYAFCTNHAEQYRKLVSDASADCPPFAATSIELVRLIVELIRIGEDPLTDEDRFFPMFFNHDNPLEELFGICIVHLNKTWKEMRAKSDDFAKVINVTREQLNYSLNLFPTDLEQFKSKLKSYAEIQDLWKEEAKIRGERDGKAIQELKGILLPDILDLIQCQRLKYISEGTKFPKPKEKGRFVFVKLSSNHKTLGYVDWNGDDAPVNEFEFESKIQVTELKDLVTGADCPHISHSRNRNRENLEHLAFSIYIEGGISLDLIAPSQKAFDYWTDALNSLLRRPMISKEAKTDTQILLDMEIKLKLLNLEGIDIPNEPPPIPPLPPNFNFCSTAEQ